MPPDNQATRLFQELRAGTDGAVDQLFPLVYEELKRIAHRHLARQFGGQTLTTTALVHETYLRLVDAAGATWQDRAHFFALASRAMRFVLVDHARARTAEKRGGARREVTLEDRHLVQDDRVEELLAIDQALERLAADSPRLGQLVQYRFFGGMSHEEIAEVSGLSVPTIKRDWARARAWLYRYMQEEDGAAPT